MSTAFPEVFLWRVGCHPCALTHPFFSLGLSCQVTVRIWRRAIQSLGRAAGMTWTHCGNNLVILNGLSYYMSPTFFFIFTTMSSTVAEHQPQWPQPPPSVSFRHDLGDPGHPKACSLFIPPDVDPEEEGTMASCCSSESMSIQPKYP